MTDVRATAAFTVSGAGSCARMLFAAWQIAALRLAVTGSIVGSVSSVARSALESQLNDTGAAAAPAGCISAADPLSAMATIRVLPSPRLTIITPSSPFARAGT